MVATLPWTTLSPYIRVHSCESKYLAHEAHAVQDSQLLSLFQSHRLSGGRNEDPQSRVPSAYCSLEGRGKGRLPGGAQIGARVPELRRIPEPWRYHSTETRSRWCLAPLWGPSVSLRGTNEERPGRDGTGGAWDVTTAGLLLPPGSPGGLAISVDVASDQGLFTSPTK